jgi:hypothetical protein
VDDEDRIDLSEIVQDLVSVLGTSGLRGRRYAVTGTSGSPQGAVAVSVAVTETNGLRHRIEIELRRG